MAGGAKKVVQTLIGCAGFRISRTGKSQRQQILDLRHITSDPIEAVYRAGSSQTSVHSSWVVINVEIERLRSYPMAFGTESPYANPFAQTVESYLDHSCVRFDGSPLAEYFKVWRPKSAAEMLGLKSEEAHEDLLRQPPFGAVCPWDFDSPRNRAQGNNPGNEGWQHCGPVSPDKGRSEFGRYKRVADAISKDGYQRNNTMDGDIAGQVLLKDSEWRIMICDGLHRFAVLQALGWCSIPVCLRRWPMLIRREDVLSWPNVANALFDERSAVKVFDRFFDSRQPATYQGQKQ